MAEHLKNPNKKRQNEINQEPNSKYRKQIENEVIASDPEVITNICNELIERIFDFLDPQSLLNVAGTCKRLQTAAAAKYGLKFGKNTTILYPKENCVDHLLKQGSRFNNNVVEVFGLTALPFLRCFGAQISKLNIGGTPSNYVARYINEYCADTLTKIDFNDLNREIYTIENFPKLFKMVTEVSLSYLSEQFSNFAYWFPNMRKLTFYTRRFDFNTIAVFPQLEHLWLAANLDSYKEKRQIERFVRANHQVRSLQISIRKLQFSKLLEMINGHSSILKLNVRFTNDKSKHVKRSLLLRFAKKHCEVAELDFLAFLLKAKDAIALIRRLTSLEYFRFRLKDSVEYYHFVSQLQEAIGVRFRAKLNRTYSTITVVELKLTR